MLKILAAEIWGAVGRKDVPTSNHTKRIIKRSTGVFVDECDRPELMELLIEKAGGVRPLARAVDENSGLITMARTGEYYNPKLMQKLGILKNPYRPRWIAAADFETLDDLDMIQDKFGISREDLLKDFVETKKAQLGIQ